MEPGSAPSFGEALDVTPVGGVDPFPLLGTAKPIDCVEHSVVVVHRLQTDSHLEANCGEQPFRVENAGSAWPDSIRATVDCATPALAASSRWLRPARTRALVRSPPATVVRGANRETTVTAPMIA